MPNFVSKKIKDTIVGRSTTFGCFGSPRADFSKCRQITYIDPKILILTEKKNLVNLVGRSVTPTF